MIDRRQLSEALARLDPRDREVLDYSLRRHVPDGDLAAVFDRGPSDVARMRAAAIERLADDLGVQRGADLGQVLTALLDNETWKDVPGAAPLDAEPAAGSGTAAAQAPSAAPASPGAQAPSAPVVGAPGGEPRSTGGDSAERRAVLGMLARDGEPALGAGTVAAPGQTATRRWSLAAAALIGVLVTIGLGAILLLGDGGSSAADQEAATRTFEPEEAELGEPFPSDPQSAYQYPVAIVEETVTLYDAPMGKPKLRVAPKTEWDSPRVLSIVERQGDWMAVLVPELPNGEVGWLRESDVARLDTVGWALRADLRTRKLEVERDGEVVKTIGIAIGRADHPTPVGRYAVTDKLRVNDPNSPYGCCVVALTGHQTKLPEGWPGGDRLAIHATGDLSGIGEAVSLGCMRTDPKDARWLMRTVPLGTPVFVEESEPPAPPTSQRKSAKR